MKTFQEFLEQVHTIEEGSREELLARMASAYDERQKPKRRTIEGDAVLSALRAGRRGKSSQILTRLQDLSRIYSSPEKRAKQLRKKTIQDLSQYYNGKEYQAAKKKAKKLVGAGLEAHHITPLHYSRTLKSQMTPEEWRERVRRDAESGIFHGHHHKNIMGTVVKGTPKSRSRLGIRHRRGGAHELESKTRDLYSTGISHKSLISAAHRIRLRKERNKKP